MRKKVGYTKPEYWKGSDCTISAEFENDTRRQDSSYDAMLDILEAEENRKFYSPYRRLMLAILARTYRDCISQSWTAWDTKKAREEAITWLTEGESDYPYSLTAIADFLGFDADKFRALCYEGLDETPIQLTLIA